MADSVSIKVSFYCTPAPKPSVHAKDHCIHQEPPQLVSCPALFWHHLAIICHHQSSGAERSFQETYSQNQVE
jgi:hypothetical protein